MALQVRDNDSVLNAAINSQIESFHFAFSPTAASGSAGKIKCSRRSARRSRQRIRRHFECVAEYEEEGANGDKGRGVRGRRGRVKGGDGYEAGGQREAKKGNAERQRERRGDEGEGRE